MIWLTWRQFRLPAAIVAGALGALAVVLAVTGPGLAHDYSTGIAACRRAGSCSDFASRFFSDHQFAFQALLIVVLAVPGIVGLFWGAPLVGRELEAGTHKLAWNQSVTRARWLAAKLALPGLAAVAVAGIASLAVGWWSRPLDRTAGREFPRLDPVAFDARGIVPVGYAVFAFVLGVAVGMLLRRVLAALAVTLVAFVAVQVAVPMLVRPHLVAPVTSTVTITPDNVAELFSQGPGGPVTVSVKVPDEGAWVLSDETVDRSGHVHDTVPISLSSPDCRPGADQSGPSPACIARIGQLGYRQRVVYQPSSRFWTLQWRETGLYLLLAAGLAGLCFWRIRRLP